MAKGKGEGKYHNRCGGCIKRRTRREKELERPTPRLIWPLTQDAQAKLKRMGLADVTRKIHELINIEIERK